MIDVHELFNRLHPEGVTIPMVELADGTVFELKLGGEDK
jgi:hypothetical protein